MTIKEIEKLVDTTLEAKGFAVSAEYAYSDSVEVEKVIYTKPEKDSEADKGSNVTIIISKGKEIVYYKVPALAGMTKKQAKPELAKYKLKLGNVTSNYSDTVAEGAVISQSLTKGTEVESGITVDITLSLGPEVTYKYVGTITISDNPFADETASGNIKLVLSQDGATKVINDGESVMNYYSFPIQLTVEGFSESEGEVIMYVDGVRYNAYSIRFNKVAE